MASWDMFRELENMRREIDRTFRGYGYSRPFTAFLSPLSTRRFPEVNLSEDEGQIHAEALVPGVEPKEINISLLRNTLTIEGERKPPFALEGQVVHRSELGFGKFSRTIELPVEVDPNRITAECRDGILHIALAKSENAKPRKIEISSR
ncbi:Hsp20/alpha crystallin family protein [Geobacter sp. SVR]|uniref:Hsp20/alpha crystallin family protein n=1 Tax=Geobacter sp. SVR TaxID=2495594 RepID=UPI00143EFDCD|nr:Hsp20/alpha crystallin family protein [Geobacter sp. SVR]BCS52948.1 molecular chaperone [Geobacter sp. SVR]GCF84332.1 molecular chaperone [Geobacter sp. SVR]